MAALTTVGLLKGIRVGVVHRTRCGTTGQEAGGHVLAHLPASAEPRVFCGAAGSATIAQFRAATAHDALGGRLRQNVTLRRAPQPKRPGKRGHPALHGPVLPSGAKRPEDRPDEDTRVRSEDREVRVRRWRNLHFRAPPGP